MRKHLIPVFLREDMFTLSGYIAPPFFDKANARMQFIFLNGRYIKDSAIFRAINEAYRGKLMPKRYPIVFLFLQVEPSEVDVNVHPTKIEVRFRNTNAIYNYVLSALKEGLNKSTTKSISVSSSSTLEEESVRAAEVDITKKFLWEQFSFVKTEGPKDANADEKSPASPLSKGGINSFTPFPKEEILAPHLGKWDGPGEFSDGKKTGPNSHPQTSAGAVRQEKKISTSEGVDKKRTYVQVHNAFIVEETDDGLNIIDQHALHEIILYHEIERGLRTSKPLNQRLLIPELVELSPKDFFSIISLKECLGEVGVEVEEFGQRTVAIRTFPQVLRSLRGKEFIESVLAELCDEDYLKGKQNIINKLISIMACKGAVKAGQKLEPQEIEALLKMKRTINAYTKNCPHGRPTTLYFSLDDLERQFKRR
jgi:DNA mismatch repair protein MutL